MPLNKAQTNYGSQQNRMTTINKTINKKLLIRVHDCALITVLSACVNTYKTITKKSYLVDTAEITQNAANFSGQSVLVRNDVLETIGEKGLILDKDRAFSGETILVIDTSEMSLRFATDKTPEILVSGKVERFILTDIEQKYSLNLDRSLYTKYEGKLAIVATRLIFSPDPGDLTRTPEIYYGKELAVKGEIEDIKSYGVFELDEEQVFGGEDLLVIKPKLKLKLHDEQTAIVYGMLRPFVAAEFERDYDLNWDLSIRQQIEAEYSLKPVLVAEKIKILE